MSLRQLNGWQRMWLVASILWAAWIVLDTLPKVPTEKKQLAFWASSIGMDVQFASNKFESVRNKHSELSDKQFIEMAPKLYPNVNFSKTLELYRSDMQNLTRYQVEGIGAIALLTFLPPAIVYGLGLVIAWIVAGFRKT